MAIDYTTAVGKVRILIPDTEQIDYNDDGEPAYLFTDEQLQVYIDLHGEDSPGIHRATADAVEALGTSEAYISKVVRTEDLQTDGAKVANALYVRARQLRQAADDEEQKEAWDAFELVEFRPLPPCPWPR